MDVPNAIYWLSSEGHMVWYSVNDPRDWGVIRNQGGSMQRQSVEVDGITLSRDQVTRAVLELAKPEPLRPGDIVQVTAGAHAGSGRRLVLDSAYPSMYIKVTDGTTTTVFPRHWCEKIGSLADGFYPAAHAEQVGYDQCKQESR